MVIHEELVLQGALLLGIPGQGLDRLVRLRWLLDLAIGVGVGVGLILPSSIDLPVKT